MTKAKKRFVILSGPSCVGKGPLTKAVKQFHEDIQYSEIPVIKSYECRGGIPRKGEEQKWKDPRYFRSAEQIKALEGNPRYIVGDCRGYPQVVDLDEVKTCSSDLIFIEIYHTIGAQLRGSDYLKNADITSVFLSPLSAEEIAGLKVSGVFLPSYLDQLMLHKLAVRTRFKVEGFTEAKIADNISRVRDAYSELKNAHNYTGVLVNHDGEGNPNWHMLPDGTFEKDAKGNSMRPEGDAGRTIGSFVKILNAGDSPDEEHWTYNII